MAEDGNGTYQLVNAEGQALASSEGYSGKGNATYPNGDVFKGDFVNGVRHGSGEYIYNLKTEEGTNDGVYNGAWDQNLRSGIGK